MNGTLRSRSTDGTPHHPAIAPVTATTGKSATAAAPAAMRSQGRLRPPSPATSRAARRTVRALTTRLPSAKAPSSARSQIDIDQTGDPARGTVDHAQRGRLEVAQRFPRPPAGGGRRRRGCRARRTGEGDSGRSRAGRLGAAGSGPSSVVSSGCPIRMICRSFSVAVSRFVRRRSCSSASGPRFWASSMISTVRRPRPWAVEQVAVERVDIGLAGCGASAGYATRSSSQTVASSSSGVSDGLSDERDVARRRAAARAGTGRWWSCRCPPRRSTARSRRRSRTPYSRWARASSVAGAQVDEARVRRVGEWPFREPEVRQRHRRTHD